MKRPNLKRARSIPKDRRCYNCNGNTYKTKNGSYQWHNYKDNKHLCIKCYGRLVVGSKYYYKNREHARAVHRDYYYRVTKPKLERRKQLLKSGVLLN